MLRLTEVRLPLDHDEAALRAAICAALGIAPEQLRAWHIRRRGYDARKAGAILFVYTLDVELAGEAAALARLRGSRHVAPAPDETYRYPVEAPANPSSRPVVIGTGPCGLFAALSLARMGFKPLVLERGRSVRRRTRDVWGFWRERRLDPVSNVQFGEGGAGTFSDGKLYSGIKDRGHHMRRILQDLVECGAPPEILYISKPHIGTLRLVKVVENLRRQILALGGEIRFEAQVTDLAIEDGALRAVRLADGTEIAARAVVLAIGHSARDTFAMLLARGVRIEPKPFSIGFRIEHPQALIDRARLGRHAGHPLLGAADYKLVYHAPNGRSVYSFCMCPGGQVVAATSEEGRVVTNGMSHYSRAEHNANAGIVVGITPADFPGRDPLAGVALQRALEERAFALGAGESANGASLHRGPRLCPGGESANGASLHRGPRLCPGGESANGASLHRGPRLCPGGESANGASLHRGPRLCPGGDYNAPVQRLGDFLAGRPSSGPGSVIPSYTPGVTWTDLSSALPDYAIAAIRAAVPAFERELPGFALPDAVLTGSETRTSSPLRIVRDADTYESVTVHGLYPAGEGAGYAGGIMSAAVDGMKVAEAVARRLVARP